MSDTPLTVIGIGADGWPGLGEPARAALIAAAEVVGSERQLDLLPAEVTATRRAWPSPMTPLVDELAAREDGAVCVLASGDPMLHGIGATLAAKAGAERLTIHPHPSAFALACARLGWAEADVELITVVARPADVVARALQRGRRVVAYVSGANGAAEVAAVARARGFGSSRFVVLVQLGGPGEAVHESTAADWGDWDADPLHVVALDCGDPDPGPPLARVPGLPDAAYETDGQLTKRHVRAATLAALGPLPGELLWDVGAGSGSIAIEWLRAERTARAIAIESRPDRAERIAANAATLGVPELEVVTGDAPVALAGLTTPDVVFIGGGIGAEGVLDTCLADLRPGGRLVANAVTMEGEQTLAAAAAGHGGELTRIEVSHAEPIGGFTAWRAALAVVQWSVQKEEG